MENKTYTIEEFRNGKVAVINDGSIGQLYEVIKHAFGFVGTDYANDRYVFKMGETFGTSNETNLPTQSVKVFYKEVLDKEIIESELKERYKKYTQQKKELYFDDNGLMYGTQSKLNELAKPRDNFFTDAIQGKPQQDTKDNINPSHYKRLPKETIVRIGDNLALEEFKGYLKGNILKYLDRYQDKNGVEDLRKMQWYLNKLIEIENGN